MRSSGFNNMANGTGDIIVKRINEVNVLQRGLPQLISINERMTLDQLQFLEADISAMSEAVKSISQLQRELDKFGVPAPDVDLYTDGGTMAGKVSTSNWVNRMTRETSLLINRVKQRVKTKQEGEIEAQRALLKSALDFKVPMLDQPSQYLKWATFNKEVFIQSAATREAASANPGFLLGLKRGKLLRVLLQVLLQCVLFIGEVFDRRSYCCVSCKRLGCQYLKHMRWLEIMSELGLEEF